MRSVTVLVFVSVSVSVIVMNPDGVTGFTVSMPWPGLEVVVAILASTAEVGSAGCVVSAARVAVDPEEVTRSVFVEVTWTVTTEAVSLREGNNGAVGDVVE
jgi:hypothetical protein